MQLLSDDGSLEPGVKLLFTIYIGYLVAAFYQLFIIRHRPHYQYNYFIITSAILYFWNFGTDIKHPIAAILLQWKLLQTFNGTKRSVILTFILQLGYYLGGIYAQDEGSHGQYKMNWLTPQCVLVLRLIGLSFDLYDGKKKTNLLTPDQQESALADPPSVTEILAYSFFPGGYLIGPQFPLTRLRKLIKQPKDDVYVRERYVEAGKQLLIGSAILIATQTLTDRFSPLYYSSNGFRELSFPVKALFVAIAGQLTVIKYLAIWTINDGNCIIMGLGFRKCGEAVQWDAVRNANLVKFAKITRFQHLIVCYNINTNGWVLKYVHKRLRFLNVRIFSHFCSMLFLAIWHGFHTGYFTAFGFQLIVINAEKEFVTAASKSPYIKNLVKKYPRLPGIAGFIYVRLLLGYCVIDFNLLHWNIYKHVYNSVFWHGHVFFVLMFLCSKMYNLSLASVTCQNDKRE